jgi:hypothetical protein
MATPREWARGYVRQAYADFQGWQAIEPDENTQPCHRMLLLQMACEKLCKARLIEAGAPPESLRSSHGYVANPLPIIIREQLLYLGQNPRGHAGLLTFARHIAAEIEVLNPSVTRNGQRPDNCEYPWDDATNALHSPLDWTFVPLQLLRQRFGPTFVKILQLAIRRALAELQS